jgi:hypothetical protein
MKCESVRELVPLYVERDLPSRRQEMVRGHIEGCSDCLVVVEQFRISQRWLHGVRAPQISGAMLDRMRRGVWRRIDAVPGPSRLWRDVERALAFMRHWAAQPAIAVVAVAMVAFGSVAVSRVSGLGDRSAQQMEAADGDLSAMDGIGSESLEEDDNLFAETAPDEPTADRMLAEAEVDDEIEPEAAMDDESRRGDDQRIEIQTGDPDVRIIWLSDDKASVEN